MRKLLVFFLGLVLVIPLAAAWQPGEKSETFEFKFQGLADWTFWTPNPEPVRLGMSTVLHLEIPGLGGPKVRVEIRKDGVYADLSGDSVVETRAERGFLTVPLKYADGSKGQYRLLLKKDGTNNWIWSRYCVMTGKVRGVSITLIDENNNGVYGEVGVDTIKIGKEDAASYVSSVVNLGKKLYNIDISPNGAKITIEPYEGPTGVLDLASGYELKSKVPSKLRLAIVQKGEDVFFNLAGKGKKFRVPTGDYKFKMGLVGSGKVQKAEIEPGEMELFTVKEDEVAKFDWGAPGLITFEVAKNQDTGEITIETGSIEIRGRGGEVYRKFAPQQFTPRVQVREKTQRKLLVNKAMGAGC